MTELMNMPISDRKYYIKLHNRSVEEERARLQKGAGGK